MSELEDRILRISELKASGLEDDGIAKALGIDIAVIKMYEDSARKIIESAVSKGCSGLEKIARYTVLSPIVVDMFSKVYGINIPEEKLQERNEPTTGRTYMQSIEAIRNAIVNGAKSVDEIAEQTNLSPNTVKVYSSQNNIILPGQVGRPSRKDIIENIRKAIEEGAKSAEEVAKKIGKSPFIVYAYARKEGIDLIHKHSKVKIPLRERRAQLLREAMDKGVNSLEDLCKIAGVEDPQTVFKYCNRFHIQLPDDLISYQQRPDIDTLIEKGLSLPEIGKQVELSRERVRQYILYSGQYKKWNERREEIKSNLRIGRAKNKMNYLKRLFLSAVRARTKELAEQEGWAFHKAVEYLYSYKHNLTDKHLIPFSKLYKLFQKYEDTKEKGEKIGVLELGKEAGLNGPSVGRILKKVGVEPMYGSNEMRIKKRGEKWEAVQRGFATDFPGPDIAYFLNLPEYLPGIRFQQKGMKREPKKTIKEFGGFGSGKKSLTYRLASEIYEAQDCEFQRSEIRNLTDASPEIVSYAIKHRNEIKPKIINGLRILYADKDIKTPYVTKEMRERLEKESERIT